MQDLTAAGVKTALAAVASAERAANLGWFFMTGPGQYGEGDVFIGVSVPQSRATAKKYAELPEGELWELAHSPVHEHRHCAMIILVGQYRKAKTQETRDALFDFYIRLLDDGCVNNWDLVDVSAPYLGSWLIDQAHAARLRDLALHPDLWHRRTAIIFTFAFIRAGKLKPTWQIAELLLGDKHDLIHKAVGWMLREAGSRDLEGLRAFLAKHSKTMPRTMLRYSIEKLDPTERKAWMTR